jgi:hypothetical protein
LERWLNESCWHSLLPALLILSLAAMVGCSGQSSVCSTEPPNLPVELRQGLNVPNDTGTGGPIDIQIRNQRVSVDQIVHGPLCDAAWSGTVYVDCDVTVPEWDRENAPTFFEGCNLTIEDNTVVYVAHHNDEAYYTGCSCHFEE